MVVLAICAPAADEIKDVSVKVVPAKKKHLETFIEVHYGDKEILLGTIVNASMTKDMPRLTWKTEKDTFYSLAMINLDAPTKANPVDGDYVHWLVGNIPGNDIGQGDTLVEYVGAFPVKDAGTQSFMFILNGQPNGKIEYTEERITKS